MQNKNKITLSSLEKLNSFGHIKRVDHIIIVDISKYFVVCFGLYMYH
jgi:hypothetical protein